MLVLELTPGSVNIACVRGIPSVCTKIVKFNVSHYCWSTLVSVHLHTLGGGERHLSVLVYLPKYCETLVSSVFGADKDRLALTKLRVHSIELGYSHHTNVSMIEPKFVAKV